jgi:hypothetical protein
LYVRSFFVRSPTAILSLKHSATRDNWAGYTNGDFCRTTTPVPLLIDLATEGRCWSDSVRSEGTMVDAMDMVLLISPKVVEEDILVVRVCEAGLLGLGIEKPCISCGPEEVLLFGITLPLIV